MKKYHIMFKYSKDGKAWTSSTTVVTAESDIGAISQVESKYTYVKDIKITAVR